MVKFIVYFILGCASNIIAHKLKDKVVGDTTEFGRFFMSGLCILFFILYSVLIYASTKYFI